MHHVQCYFVFVHLLASSENQAVLKVVCRCTYELLRDPHIRTMNILTSEVDYFRGSYLKPCGDQIQAFLMYLYFYTFCIAAILLVGFMPPYWKRQRQEKHNVSLLLAEIISSVSYWFCTDYIPWRIWLCASGPIGITRRHLQRSSFSY